MCRMGLWTDVRGSGDPLLLLLHGLNATAAVWEPLDAVVDASWPGRRVLIDLPGHGRSDPLAEYSFGVVAAEVARAVGPTTASVVAVGHSMGGVVAMTLASGWFGIPVARAVAIGVKVDWSADELDTAARMRERPVKWYDTREGAEDRFVRLAGLPTQAASDARVRTRGVQAANRQFRVAADPRVGSIGAPPIESLIAAAVAPVRLACGGFDHMVSIHQLRRFDPEAVVIPECGHSAHVERPSALARLITNAAPPVEVADHALSDS
jgi:pimeloyl-ACP methyl ester carboxylesterase